MTGRFFASAIVAAILAAAYRGVPANESPTQGSATTAKDVGLTGTASCSGRGCHGRLSSGAADTLGQNEYIRWLQHDPHAEAFAVLSNARSQQIARNLNIADAAKDARCLACHAVPQTAVSEVLRAEQQWGVGCEACHGPAESWLAEHSAGKRGPDSKMTATGELLTRAKVCAGCHVGAPPHDQTPLRDVNHDLIAAGHPRLNFEYSAYMANMPAHWRPDRLRTEKNGSELRDWAVGQVVAAEAALRLLAYRASETEMLKKPWPEFTEYECYACHHDLGVSSWRQDRGYSGRKPGSLPWGTWSMTLIERLAANSKATFGVDPPAGVVATLDELGALMSRPATERAKVQSLAEKLTSEFSMWGKSLAAAQPDPDAARRLFAAIAEAPAEHWDGAAQLYLALSALEKSARPGDEKTRQSLKGLFDHLDRSMRPSDDSPERLDSPHRFDPAALKRELDSLRKTARP